MFDKHRRRRVICNDDADQQYHGPQYDSYSYKIFDKQSFLEARTAATFDTHVDTYVWCVGNGCQPPWGRSGSLRPFLESNEHATDLIVEACHAKGIEVWGSLRMNDIHDNEMPPEKQADPLKAQRPDYLIPVRYDKNEFPELLEAHLKTAFNYALPAVRRYRLDFVEKNATAHDFDGYELDFTRMIWNFPIGSERPNASHMTDFMREVRAVLDSIGNRRKRHYTLAVHVLDSPEGSLLSLIHI